jgi:CHAT domain-containing protein
MTRFFLRSPLPRKVWQSSVLFLTALLFCVLLNCLPNATVSAQSSSAEQLVQQGIEQYEAGKYAEAIERWQTALSQPLTPSAQAVVHQNLAQAYRRMGKLDRAITQWEQAVEIYRSQPKGQASLKALVQVQIEQAQAFNDLGQHERSVTLLQSTVALARQIADPKLEAAAQGSLGNAYWSLGEYESALVAQQASLTLARKLQEPTYVSNALNNLGNVYASRVERNRYRLEAARLEGDIAAENELSKAVANDTQAALQVYEQGVEQSRSLGGLAEARALLNLNRLLESLAGNNTASVKDNDTIANRNRALALIQPQPDSQDKASLLIGVANSLIRTAERDKHSNLQQAAALLQEALRVARAIDDRRTESFALGSLGRLYELQNDYTTALQITRQAQFSAQQISAADSLYRWYWQLGRVLKARGDTEAAIRAYEQAIATLQSIRGDIIAANQDLQFDFRDSVEPIYRELITLLFDRGEPVASHSQLKAQAKTEPGTTDPKTIQKVLDTLELLKLAELQNFFGDDCVQVAQAIVEQEQATLSGTELGKVSPNTAVVYSVVLDDRTELILRHPDNTVTSYRVNLGAKQLQAEVDTLRSLLERRATDEYLPQAQLLYNLLIAPLEPSLATIQANTVVFIHDGVLRKVPMAALHDGKQFLVQKYAIAVTPSLSLTTRQAFDHSQLQALILGLTVEQPPFAALENVATETDIVQRILGGVELLDQKFTLVDVQTQLQRNTYPVVHMATHGKFGADAESTFLLGYESRITIRQLDTALRNRRGLQPVELLTLSACQTAAGDNRSALGIAGVAVRAGVKSALASLWFINDEATVPLIEAFYTQLRQPGTSKAEALRQAQLQLLTSPDYRDYNHPAVWSPFILIGNWL